MSLECLALCPFRVKNKLSINKEVRELVCTQVCSQVCTQRGPEKGAEWLSSPTLVTQNSPPCCCRVRKSPQAGAGPAAGSRSPGGLQGRLQPVYAERPGETRRKWHRSDQALLRRVYFLQRPWEVHFGKWLIYQFELIVTLVTWHLSDTVLLVTWSL